MDPNEKAPLYPTTGLRAERGTFTMLSSEQRKEAERQAIEVLRKYSTDRGMSFLAEVLIVSGTRSDQASQNRRT